MSHSGIATSFHIEGTPFSLPPIIEIALYRVAQEALANVLKHAQATKVDVTLHFRGPDLCLELRDNGRGFDLAQALGKAKSLGRVGLSDMKDRAETLGGTLSIETAEGAGTMVALTLPLSTPLPKELSSIARMLNG